MPDESGIPTIFNPNVNMLFSSALTACGFTSVLAVLMTGIGDDGAKGLHELYKAGAQCIGENERDCVVYGMPKRAKELNPRLDMGGIKDITEAQASKQPLTDNQKERLDASRQQIRDIRSQYVCTPLILAKYLHLQYKDGMKVEDLTPKMEPSVIAQFIIDYNGTAWEYLPVKMEAVNYSIRIDKKSNWKAADAASHIEIPHACPSIVTAMTDKNILADIQNDINVLDEYIAWYQASGSLNLTNEYQAIYNNFVRQLRTLDISIDTFRQKKDSPKKEERPVTPEPAREGMTMQSSGMTYVAIQNKIMRGEPLNESDQLYLIRVKHECPKCGRKLTEHTSQIGRKYVSCDCQYYAPGTFENPAIDEKYKTGVIRQRP